MRYSYYFLLFIVLTSCKKDNQTEPQANNNNNTNSTNTAPSISITQPTDNFNVYLGQSFSLEGLATDQEGLASIDYEISTPSASFNYTNNSFFAISGTNKDFNQSITIDKAASVGSGIITVYAKDDKGEKSSIITRNFKIADTIPPVITNLQNNVGETDLITINVFKNSNNVVDSVVIYNQTKGQIMATISEVGGFKTMICSIVLASLSPEYVQFYDLISASQSTFSYQIGVSGAPDKTFLSVGFREYDNFYNNSVPYSDYSAKFDLP